MIITGFSLPQTSLTAASDAEAERGAKVFSYLTSLLSPVVAFDRSID